MKIQWWGHSAFVLTAQNDKIVLTDPYESGCYNNTFNYAPITVSADIVTASHSHPDHFTRKLNGNPKVITKKGNYETGGIKVKGVAAFHDANQGRDRGANIIFVYEIDGIRIVHLGDIGHTLSQKELDEIGLVDILLVPVGGHFTIDADQASDVAGSLKPKITMPMHYKTEVLDFPIAGVDSFIRGKKGVKKLASSEVSITKEALPTEPEIWVLQYTK